MTSALSPVPSGSNWKVFPGAAELMVTAAGHSPRICQYRDAQSRAEVLTRPGPAGVVGGSATSQASETPWLKTEWSLETTVVIDPAPCEIKYQAAT